MVVVNNKSEIIDVQEADQFQPSESQFECGYFACAIAATMSKPGQLPKQNAAQVIANAEKWYAQYDGSDSITNAAGMTNEQEYELLHQIGLHYQAIATDLTQVKAWLNVGYPVLLGVQETSVHDLLLDGANPYPWTPSGTHIILATGLASGGNILVRDSANVTSLSNANSLRSGPRTYDAQKLQLVSATVVVPPWRPRPVSATAIPTADLQIPDGWTDDEPNQTLTAPNGIKVVDDFRMYVLTNNWYPADVPLAEEAPADPVELGYNQPNGQNAGTRQIFMYREICWTSTRGIYTASVGREFWTLLQRLQSARPNETASTKPTSQAASLVGEIQAAAKLIGETGAHILEKTGQLNALFV